MSVDAVAPVAAIDADPKMFDDGARAALADLFKTQCSSASNNEVCFGHTAAVLLALVKLTISSDQT